MAPTERRSRPRTLEASLLAAGIGLVGLLVPAPARATYSIVLADRASGTVAVGVASCVPLEVVKRVAGLVRGKGAFVTQSHLFAPAHIEASRALGAGEEPSGIVSRLLEPRFDADAGLRQYGVVTLDGAVASHTGDRTLAFASHATHREEGLVVVLQGNVLTGRDTLDAMATAFVGEKGDPLERLVAAFEAPASHVPVLGDARCTGSGRSALSATLDIVGPDEGDDLHAEAEATSGGADPLRGIRAAFMAYREARKPSPDRSRPAPVVTPAAPWVPAETSGCASSGGGVAEPASALTLLLGLVVMARAGRRWARFRLETTECAQTPEVDSPHRRGTSRAERGSLSPLLRGAVPRREERFQPAT